jgi:hypothetical protein
MRLPLNVFLAWGPPKFPIHVNDEPITDSEMAQCK